MAKVRDLISLYEQKSPLLRDNAGSPVQQSVQPVSPARTRAKSLGNVLGRNAFTFSPTSTVSFTDVQEDLDNIETYLKYYNVYNKKNHVAIQEQLFNILSNIVNIESTNDQDAVRKIELIRETQRLVNVLNFKLPQENFKENQSEDLQHVSYLEFVRQRSEQKSPKASLKSNYEKSPANSPKENGKEDNLQYTQIDSEQRPAMWINYKTNEDENVTELDGPIKQPEEQEVEEVKEPLAKTVSVSKLRSMFEERCKENPKGLEILLSPTGPTFHRSMSNIPYTERNLGNIRLQQSLSGNYMSYNRLLHNTEINRSKSTNDILNDNVDEDKVDFIKQNDLSDSEDSEDESNSEETLTDDENNNRIEEGEVSHVPRIAVTSEDQMEHSSMSYNEPAPEKLEISNTPETIKEETIYEETVNENEYKHPVVSYEPATEKLEITYAPHSIQELKIDENHNMDQIDEESDVENEIPENKEYEEIVQQNLNDLNDNNVYEDVANGTNENNDDLLTDEDFEEVKNIEKINEEFEKLIKDNDISMESVCTTKV